MRFGWSLDGQPAAGANAVLHGFGIERDAGIYTGHFTDGVRNGRGVHSILKQNHVSETYDGWWRRGVRHERGIVAEAGPGTSKTCVGVWEDGELAAFLQCVDKGVHATKAGFHHRDWELAPAAAAAPAAVQTRAGSVSKRIQWAQFGTRFTSGGRRVYHGDVVISHATGDGDAEPAGHAEASSQEPTRSLPPQRVDLVLAHGWGFAVDDLRGEKWQLYGQWERGRFAGMGQLSFPSGAGFVGNFSAGMPQTGWFLLPEQDAGAHYASCGIGEDEAAADRSGVASLVLQLCEQAAAFAHDTAASVTATSPAVLGVRPSKSEGSERHSDPRPVIDGRFASLLATLAASLVTIAVWRLMGRRPAGLRAADAQRCCAASRRASRRTQPAPRRQQSKPKQQRRSSGKDADVAAMKRPTPVAARGTVAAADPSAAMDACARSMAEGGRYAAAEIERAEQHSLTEGEDAPETTHEWQEVQRGSAKQAKVNKEAKNEERSREELAAGLPMARDCGASVPPSGGRADAETDSRVGCDAKSKAEGESCSRGVDELAVHSVGVADSCTTGDLSGVADEEHTTVSKEPDALPARKAPFSVSAPQRDRRLVLRLGGLMCGGCKRKAESSLLAVQDVLGVQVSLSPPLASVTVRAELKTGVLGALEGALSSAGFSLVAVQVDDGAIGESGATARTSPGARHQGADGSGPTAVGNVIGSLQNAVGAPTVRRYRCGCGCEECICSPVPVMDGDPGMEIGLSEICDRLEGSLREGLLAFGDLNKVAVTDADMREVLCSADTRLRCPCDQWVG